MLILIINGETFTFFGASMVDCIKLAIKEHGGNAKVQSMVWSGSNENNL